MLIPIASLRQDGGTQPRATIHVDWIEEYALDMASGAVFPPVTVFHDGADYWLADGFHRTRAARAAGRSEIEADVRQGSQRDAVLFSVSANATHGNRRTNDDKRRAVLCLLHDGEWAKWSDGEIARRCGVSQPFVSGIRPKPPTPPVTHNDYELGQRTYTTKHGTTAVMNTANIGRRPEQASAPAPPPEPPGDDTEDLWPDDPEPPPEPVRAAPEPPPRPFNFDTANLRSKAMNAILVLADQPEPQAVIDAWMEHAGYDDPPETIAKALAWLAEFAALHRAASPGRAEKLRRYIERLKNVA